MARLNGDVNEILEAEVSASDSGLKPSKSNFHLMLGPAPQSDIVLTPLEALRRVGWAIADQLKIDDEMIRKEAEGARSLIMGLDEDGDVVVKFDIALPKRLAVDSLIDGGLERQRSQAAE